VEGRLRETRFSDVCGTIDELRKMLDEGRRNLEETTAVLNLIDDALYMIGRMLSRIREYEGSGRS